MFVCESNLMTVYVRLKMTSLMLKASQVPSNDNNRTRCAFTRCCLLFCGICTWNSSTLRKQD